MDKFKRESLKTDLYTAVHMRNLEGTCKRMMGSLLWAINGTARQRWAGPQQCEMSSAYIARAQRDKGKQIVYLATDGQVWGVVRCRGHLASGVGGLQKDSRRPLVRLNGASCAP